MAAAHDEAGCRHHAVNAVSARQLGTLLDAVDRDFAGAAKHGENRAVTQEVDGIIAPFAGGDLAAIEPENAIELAPVESHASRGGESRCLAPVRLARFSIAVIHRLLPCERIGSR